MFKSLFPESSFQFNKYLSSANYVQGGGEAVSRTPEGVGEEGC